MNMREIMDAVSLNEGRVFKIQFDDFDGNSFMPFKVVKNPSRDQIASFGNVELRAIIDRRGDFYVWDAYQATHDGVAHELMLSIEHMFVIDEDKILSDDPEILENSHVVRAFKGREMRIE